MSSIIQCECFPIRILILTKIYNIKTKHSNLKVSACDREISTNEVRRTTSAWNHAYAIYTSEHCSNLFCCHSLTVDINQTEFSYNDSFYTGTPVVCKHTSYIKQCIVGNEWASCWSRRRKLETFAVEVNCKFCYFLLFCSAEAPYLLTKSL